jgi:DNA-binding response OmpR family regulator
MCGRAGRITGFLSTQPTDIAMRIASLEDEPAHAELIRQILIAAGHTCLSFERGHDLLVALRTEQVDLLLLDWFLPDFNGKEVLLWVRTHLDRHLPVIFLSCSSAEEHIVGGLTCGADDYIAKPIRKSELLARIQCVRRRVYPSWAGGDAALCAGDYTFDTAARTATCREQRIELTPKEFDLALLMFRNEGRIVSRNHIVAAVWGRELSPFSRTVDTHVSRVRAKLGLRDANGYRLTPVYTHGYRLEEAGASRPDDWNPAEADA